MTAAQEAAPETAGGVLYLTDTALTPQRDDACPQGQLRYEMTVNQTRVAESAAEATSLSNPARACPTRFLYPVQSAFRLEGDVLVVLRIRCDTQTPGGPGDVPVSEIDLESVEAILTNDPNANTVTLGIANPGGSDPVSAIVGTRVPSPQTCGPEPFDVEVPMTAAGMDLSPGGSLTLMVRIFYTTGPDDAAPRVELLTGPTTGSRIEAQSIPSPEQESTGARAPPRPRLFWSATSQQEGTGCNSGTPIYDLVPEDAPPAAGVIALSLSTPANFGCVSMLEYAAVEPFTLNGSVSVRFWFRCADPSLGSPSDFQLRFRHVLAVRVAGGEGEEIATPSRTGNVATISACPTAPLEVAAESVLPQPKLFQPGDRFRVEVVPFYANGPYAARDQVSQVEVLTGPDHHSHVAVGGLPWQARADPEGPGLPGPIVAPLANSTAPLATPVTTTSEGQTPAPAVALVAAAMGLAVVLSRRRA